MHKNKSTCVIIGLGKMGEKYIRISKEINLKIIGIYDRDKNRKIEIVISNKLHKLKNYSNLNDILKLKPEVALIASTADGHYDLIKKCAQNGIKKIMVEKPITTSLTSCQKIKKLIKRNKISLCVNQSYVFSNQYSYLKKIISSKKFGDLVSLNFIGGNSGISMNGIHYFSIIKFLTNSNVKEVISNIKVDTNLNPRGIKFKDFEGQISLLNDNGSRGYIDLSNKAGHGETLTCVFKFGIIFVDLFTGVVIKNFRKPSQKKFSTVFYSKPYISKKEKIKISDTSSITKINLINFLREKNYVNLDEGIRSMKILIASIESSKKGISINLNKFKNKKSFNWA